MRSILRTPILEQKLKNGSVEEVFIVEPRTSGHGRVILCKSGRAQVKIIILKKTVCKSFFIICGFPEEVPLFKR